jgi:hypothetical protein
MPRRGVSWSVTDGYILTILSVPLFSNNSVQVPATSPGLVAGDINIIVVVPDVKPSTFVFFGVDKLLQGVQTCESMIGYARV